jgi:hypothetical protein
MIDEHLLCRVDNPACANVIKHLLKHGETDSVVLRVRSKCERTASLDTIRLLWQGGAIKKVGVQKLGKSSTYVLADDWKYRLDEIKALRKKQICSRRKMPEPTAKKSKAKNGTTHDKNGDPLDWRRDWKPFADPIIHAIMGNI